MGLNMCASSENDGPIGDSKKTGNFLAGALLERPLRYLPRDPPSLPERGLIHNIPVEILLKILQGAVPPCTRDGLYDLSRLTHVCRFWRAALINQPHAWSTVFITQKDRRSFVEACLERSHSAALDITVDARRLGRIRPDCTCDKREQGRLFPNEPDAVDPCEWHFQFESLADTKHPHRIRALDIDFGGTWWGPEEERAEKIRLELGSCRFFTSSFPQLTTLTWSDEGAEYASHLFSTSPFTPTLRSLSYAGPWDGMVAPVNNLTSLVIEGNGSDMTPMEDVRLLLLNNRLLESLGLGFVIFKDNSTGPPVLLSNLKSLNVGFADDRLSTIIRVPALQYLSSLRIGSDDAESYTLYATGDGIVFSAKCSPGDLAETWEDYTGYYASPTIHHIRLEDSEPIRDYGFEIEYNDSTFISVLSDAHTLEIGNGYFPCWYDTFLDDLKKLGPQLKTIRFAIPDELESFRGDGDGNWQQDSGLLNNIEDLVRYRFNQGRPLATVERMVTSKDERRNGEQGWTWKRFYNGRQLSEFVQPG